AFILKRKMNSQPKEALTGDLHHAVLGLHHQLLRGKVVDVQGNLPAVRGLPDLRDAAAELAAQGPAVGRVGGVWRGDDGAGDSYWLGGLAGHQAEVTRPAGAAWPLAPVLENVGQAEGLVKEPAAQVPVPPGVPAGVAEESEGHPALRHVVLPVLPRQSGLAAVAGGGVSACFSLEPLPRAGPL
uniref:Uncharacterized protein n=1 Tax=Chelonoidis abingdonii TaxID=106734 RepID=A0A8C0GBY8_CHEAB